MLNGFKAINDKTHVRESLSVFTEGFMERYAISGCRIANLKNGEILFEKGAVSGDEKAVTVLRQNGLEDVRMYTEPPLAGNAAPGLDTEIEFLKVLVLNHLLYRSILRVSKSRMQKTKEVETLMEISRELIFLHDERNILNALVFAIMGQVMVTKTAIYLNGADGFELKTSRGFKDLPAGLEMIKTLKKILDLDERREFLINPEMNLLHESGVSIIVPMQYQNSVTGYILLGGKTDGTGVRETEYDFLFSLAANVAFSLENSRLIKESMEKKRMDDELSLARDIQMNILPKKVPDYGDWDIYATNIPSREVGGDYFYVREKRGKLYFAIADVTGKSVPAALLVSTLHAAFMLMTEVEVPLEVMVTDINNLIYESTRSDQFITFFIGIIDKENGIFRYINAGHNPPYALFDDGTLAELDSGGLLLGIMPDPPYEQGELDYDSVRTVLLFTDGITEAMDAEDQEFGEERLKNILSAQSSLSSGELGEYIISEVNGFKTKGVLQDDMTLVALKRGGR